MKLLPMPEHEYRAHEALGFHDLLNLSKSYLHFLEGRKPKEKIESYFIFGQAAHMMALEPEKFESTVVAKPSFDRRTKDGKSAHEAFISANMEKVIVTEDEFYSLKEMQKILFQSEHFQNIKSCAKFFESCAFAENHGLQLKGRIDCAGVVGNTPFLLEYKTTQDASPESFFWDIKKYKYDLQLCYYAYIAGVLENCKLFIVAQEKVAPFDFTIWELEVDNTLIGRMVALLETAKQNMDKKTGYQKDINLFKQQ